MTSMQENSTTSTATTVATRTDKSLPVYPTKPVSPAASEMSKRHGDPAEWDAATMDIYLELGGAA